MVLIRLPLTITGNFWRAGCCACALFRRPQPQKTMPVAAAAVPAFKKLRRVVMRFPPWLLFAGAVCHRHAVLVPPLR